MNFDDLYAFTCVARQRSFSRAAVQMRIAQSALSRRVGRLEHQFGIKLLTRHARGVQLTDAGQNLFERADRLMNELDLIRRDLSNLAVEPTGKVRVAFPPTTGQVLAPALVEECRRKFPRINLQLREGFTGSLHEWLVSGQLDLALYYNPEASAEVEITPLLNEPLYLVAPAGGDNSQLEDIINTSGNGTDTFPARKLGEIPLLLPTRSHSIRLVVERFAKENGFQLRIVNEVDGTHLLKGMVEKGLGYTIFSYAGIYDEVGAGTLRIYPLKPQLTWQLAIVHTNRMDSFSALAAVKSLIENQIHTLSERGFWRGKLLTQKQRGGNKA